MRFTIRKGCSPSPILWPSPGSSPAVTRPRSPCISSDARSYPGHAEKPHGLLLPVPDIRRLATPSALPHAAGRPAYACRPSRVLSCTPSARCPTWSPPQRVPSSRSGESAEGAFPSAALRSVRDTLASYGPCYPTIFPTTMSTHQGKSSKLSGMRFLMSPSSRHRRRRLCS